MTINTGKLVVRDGADIFAATYGAGRGGNITINAENVEISGTGKVGNTVFASGLVSQTESQATGNAGDVLVTTSKLADKSNVKGIELVWK